MRWQRRYQHIQIGLKKRSISDYSSGMVSYVAIYYAHFISTYFRNE